MQMWENVVSPESWFHAADHWGRARVLGSLGRKMYLRRIARFGTPTAGIESTAVRAEVLRPSDNLHWGRMAFPPQKKNKYHKKISSLTRT